MDISIDSYLAFFYCIEQFKIISFLVTFYIYHDQSDIYLASKVIFSMLAKYGDYLSLQLQRFQIQY